MGSFPVPLNTACASVWKVFPRWHDRLFGAGEDPTAVPVQGSGDGGTKGGYTCHVMPTLPSRCVIGTEASIVGRY